MPNFRYKARDKYGKPLTGVITSENRELAFSYIKNSGYIPVTVEQFDNPYMERGFLTRFSRVNLEELLAFTRQLVTLQTSGLPLLTSLEALKEQSENKLLKNVIARIIIDIKGGLSFSDALAKHPNIFNELYVNMVKAGEASGKLDEILERLAILSEHQMQTQSKIKSATMYPIIVIFTLIGAFIAMIVFVLPKFAELFSSFNVELPLPTRILLGINYIVQNYWYIILAVVGILVFLVNRYVNTSIGRRMWDGLKLRIPIFGPLILKIIISRFARITGALIKSGIPLLQVLEMTSKTAGNVVVAESLNKVRRSVNEGKPMHEPMKEDKLFPPLVVHMVAVGENTGKLDHLLSRVSDYYDGQVDYTLKNLTTAIEPILIFCLGGMVLVMALAIFLPMWNLLQVFKR